LCAFLRNKLQKLANEFRGDEEDLSGAEEAAEKGLFESKCRLKVLQGLKSNIDLIGFIGMRPRPRGFPGTPVMP
jgi:hypothetical protein